LAKELLSGRPITVIDVRSQSDFNGTRGHIREARNVPLTEIADHLPEMMAFRDEPVILVCRMHKMSSSAADKFVAARPTMTIAGRESEWSGASRLGSMHIRRNHASLPAFVVSSSPLPWNATREGFRRAQKVLKLKPCLIGESVIILSVAPVWKLGGTTKVTSSCLA